MGAWFQPHALHAQVYARTCGMPCGYPSLTKATPPIPAHRQRMWLHPSVFSTAAPHEGQLGQPWRRLKESNAASAAAFSTCSGWSQVGHRALSKSMPGVGRMPSLQCGQLCMPSCASSCGWEVGQHAAAGHVNGVLRWRRTQMFTPKSLTHPCTHSHRPDVPCPPAPSACSPGGGQEC